MKTDCYIVDDAGNRLASELTLKESIVKAQELADHCGKTMYVYMGEEDYIPLHIEPSKRNET